MNTKGTEKKLTDSDKKALTHITLFILVVFAAIYLIARLSSQRVTMTIDSTPRMEKIPR